MVRPTLGTRFNIKAMAGGLPRPLIAGIARKLGENGQYFAWNLAKGVRDKTVGKPPTWRLRLEVSGVTATGGEGRVAWVMRCHPCRTALTDTSSSLHSLTLVVA
jgi:hypothetical protein